MGGHSVRLVFNPVRVVGFLVPSGSSDHQDGVIVS